ncbi:MAG TPA: acylneuraminate cytidylyltransferase family protein [Lacunisphaera sp.]|jgi:CMP-N-acetylneuraminic acid synthetase
METLITICARGGSQGVKKKNIRSLLGKPLIAHTIECALKWGKASRVIVSTDSEEIARVAKQYGAEAPFLRPPHLAEGSVPKLAVIRHALLALEQNGQPQFDVVVDLDATAPLRHVSDVENAYQLFQERRALTLLSVVNARKNPYYNVVEAGAEGFVHLSKEPDASITCRQMAPVVYDMNASIHIYRREYVLEESNKHVISKRAVPYVMDDLCAVDIDHELDFLFIEFLLKNKIYIP